MHKVVNMAKKKKQTKAQIREKARAYAKKMTLGKAHYIHAEGGSLIQGGLQYMVDKDQDAFKRRFMVTYTGIDITDYSIHLDRLIEGHGGLLHEKAYRKFAQAMGFRAYPSGKPKTIRAAMDWASMYLVPVTKAYANKDNMAEAHRQVYLSLYGIDLGQQGWAAWQPAAMMETKGLYSIQKLIKNTIKGW